MLNSIKLLFLCFYLLFGQLFRTFKKVGQKTWKFRWTRLIAFDIYWPNRKSRFLLRKLKVKSKFYDELDGQYFVKPHLCIAATAWEKAAAAEEFIIFLSPWCPGVILPIPTPPTSMSGPCGGLTVKGGLCPDSAVAVSDPSSSPFKDLSPSS